MPNCPHCSYELILLSYRQKYKCALCSKLFLKKEIENKEFREWNQRQRLLDLEESLKLKKRLKLTEEEKLQRKRNYYLKNKNKILEYNKLWRTENKDRIRDKRREKYTKNKEHLNAKRRERYNMKNKQVLNYQKSWGQNHLHNYRMKRRLADLREQQKCLALKQFKNKEYKLYTAEFQEVLPTFLLSDLL